jgi:hypothetical protein
MNLIKKTGTSMSIEAKYLEGKARGFKHPAEVTEQMEIYKTQCAEVKKLKKFCSSLYKEEKELYQLEEKAAKVFADEATTDNQNPKSGRVYSMFADAKTQIAASRASYTSNLQNIIADWKVLSKNELGKLDKLLETANKSLVTRQYHEADKNYIPAKQWDEKYSVQIIEFVNAVHLLRQQKEELHPQFILRSLQSEATLYRTIISQYEMCEAAIRTLGQVEPIRFPGFFMENRTYTGATQADMQHHNPYAGVNTAQPQGYGQPVVTQQTVVVTHTPLPIPVPVMSAGPRARALYAFQASSEAELSFQVGDILTIVSQDGGWWTAELNGRRGFVPSNYVELC